MKVKEYVNRFYAGIAACDAKVVNAMVDVLILEANAEIGVSNDEDSEKLEKRIFWKFNEKGNAIADAMNALYHQEHPGVDIVRKDWFKAVASFGGASQPQSLTDYEKKKERRKQNAKRRAEKHKTGSDAAAKSEKQKMIEEVSSWE